MYYYLSSTTMSIWTHRVHLSMSVPIKTNNLSVELESCHLVIMVVSTYRCIINKRDILLSLPPHHLYFLSLPPTVATSHSKLSFITLSLSFYSKCKTKSTHSFSSIFLSLFLHLTSIIAGPSRK